MRSSITKYVIGAVAVVIIAAYAIWSGNNNNGSSATLPPLSQGSSSSDGMPAGAGTSSTTTPTGGPTTSTGPYKDGAYTGSVADAFYGQLQAAVTVSGGKITNVTFPVYPDEPGHTTQVSQMALPALAQEAIAAQSANVNIVSGATQDSEAFRQSLASALAQAQ